MAVGAEQENATPSETKELRLHKIGSGGRTRTPGAGSRSQTEPTQNSANRLHISTSHEGPASAGDQSATLPVHSPDPCSDISAHQKCALFVPATDGLPEDLARGVWYTPSRNAAV